MPKTITDARIKELRESPYYREGALPVPRGCGERIRGGIYGEFAAPEPTATGGNLPAIMACVLDYPVPLSAMPITPQGAHLVKDAQGVWHIADWVGSTHYANIYDFLVEASIAGVSRRLSRNLNLSLLTEDSRLILAHARAIVHSDDVIRFRTAPTLALATDDEAPIETLDWNCPLGFVAHEPLLAGLTSGTLTYRDSCAGLWEQDILHGEPIDLAAPEAARNEDGLISSVGGATYLPDNPRLCRRILPCGRYVARSGPETAAGAVPSPIRYEPGYFAMFPLTRLVGVGGEEAVGEFGMKTLRACGIPVRFTPA